MKIKFTYVFFCLLSTLAHGNVRTCSYGKSQGCPDDSYCIKYEQDKDICLEKFKGDLKVVPYPFANKVSSFCDQGPLSPSGNSHTWNNTAFAVDLKSLSEKNVPILAGFDGKIIAYDACKTENDQCGLGFGNQVKILTEDNFIIFYAHLAQVSVATGQRVKAGTVIGTEGVTGWAGPKNKHLHLSVHYGWKELGEEYWKNVGYLPRSVPFKIKSCDNKTFSVEELKCKRVTSGPERFCL